MKTHDYAGGGVYYITLTTEGRRRLFGTVINGRMVLNDAGVVVRDEWLKSAEIRAEIAFGRLLIVTPFPKTVSHVNAAQAAWCNQYLLHMADTVVIGQLNPDGLLACLLSDLPCDKPIVIHNQ